MRVILFSKTGKIIQNNWNEMKLLRWEKLKKIILKNENENNGDFSTKSKSIIERKTNNNAAKYHHGFFFYTDRHRSKIMKTLKIHSKKSLASCWYCNTIVFLGKIRCMFLLKDKNKKNKERKLYKK